MEIPIRWQRKERDVIPTLQVRGFVKLLSIRILERKKAASSPVPTGHGGGSVHEAELSQGVGVCLSPVVWLMGATVVLLNAVTEV